MRILLGYRAPGPLRNNPAGHITDTAPDRHWQELRNGGLLDQAQAGGITLGYCCSLGDPGPPDYFVGVDPLLRGLPYGQVVLG